MNTYTYSITKSTWGIHVTVTGEVRLVRDATPGVRVTLPPNPKLQPIEIKAVRFGAVMGLVLADAPAAFCEVRVSEVSFALTDYQPEGLAWALAGMVCEGLGQQMRLPAVEFDRERNCYLFDLDLQEELSGPEVEVVASSAAPVLAEG